MFTGIVAGVGRVVSASADDVMRVDVLVDDSIGVPEVGASIACSGVCLTVLDGTSDRRRFTVGASSETLSRTTVGRWREGTLVNLERSLKAGDEMGGHFVAGHVDGVAYVESSDEDDAGGASLLVRVPDGLSADLVAPKGSVALDGTSLTVNDVAGRRFNVHLIPHTRRATTLGRLRVGDGLNMEVDLLARYVAASLNRGRRNE